MQTQESHGDFQWLRHALTEDWLFSLLHPIVDADTG